MLVGQGLTDLLFSARQVAPPVPGGDELRVGYAQSIETSGRMALLVSQGLPDLLFRGRRGA